MTGMKKTLYGFLFIFAFILSGATQHPANASDVTKISIDYIARDFMLPPTLSNLDPFAADTGLQGAMLGIADSNTTGRFLDQDFKLRTIIIAEEEELADGLEKTGKLNGLIVTTLPAGDLTALSEMLDESAPEALVFNAGAADNSLRNAECIRNVLHTLPSWAMLSDALAQFALRKRWTEWLLLTGPDPDDRQFSSSLRQSAKKFGTKIVEDIEWDTNSDLRRNAHEEIPLLTNNSDYDLVAVTDRFGDFARYLPFNTFRPRPVIGSEGLQPVAWSRVVEQWGAAQLQSRFTEQAGRPMQAVDYAAWAAVRSIAEAAARTKSADPAVLRAYMLSDKFQLAAFKGRKMSFRDWNGQLRQPIPLVHSRAVVTTAPLDGFLHPVSEMDTLGFDRPLSKCEAFKK